MSFIKNLIARLIGKQIGDDFGVSKAKLAAIVFVLVVSIQELSKAWGHPVVIPDYVFKLLEGAGLWAVRDAIKA